MFSVHFVVVQAGSRIQREKEKQLRGERPGVHGDSQAAVIYHCSGTRQCS